MPTLKTIGDNYGSLYQIETASDISDDQRLRLESVAISQVRRLPGGRTMDLTIEYDAAAGKAIMLTGYPSSKPSSVRPLQGPGVADGQLALMGSGSVRVLLAAGVWTVQP